MGTALSIDLVDDLANSKGLRSRELRQLTQPSLHGSVHRLSLVNEAVLIPSTPGPAFVFDQLFASPSRARGLTPSNRSGRGDGVFKTLHLIKGAACRVSILIPMSFLPISDPSSAWVLSLIHI